MTDQQFVNTSSDEISLKALMQMLRGWFFFILSQWWKIVLVASSTGIIGFFYAKVKPITYTAKTIFVVEEAKSSSGLSNLASLAGQFGVDLGGGAGGGLIAGENILLYFKSESLAREVLLSEWNDSSNKSVADIYIEAHKIKDVWAKDKNIGVIEFKPGLITQGRLKDSLLNSITITILKDQVDISKVEKKASFLQLKVTMGDEKLAKVYCDRLLDLAVKRYVSLKTERQYKTVLKLQARVDSIGYLLKNKTSSYASLQTAVATMDINPLYRTNTIVATDLTTRDKTMLTAVYAEVVKNLELAKFTLSQETPVIQVVDTDLFPLKKNKYSKLKFALFFGVGSVFVFFIGLFFIRAFKANVS